MGRDIVLDSIVLIWYRGYFRRAGSLNCLLAQGTRSYEGSDCQARVLVKQTLTPLHGQFGRLFAPGDRFRFSNQIDDCDQVVWSRECIRPDPGPAGCVCDKRHRRVQPGIAFIACQGYEQRFYIFQLAGQQ